ncbi:hypothetical protein ASPFODRAFT_708857 [Aspergillus luchuensis CBS 106.47]|uniref:Uncharacterized protein n=1 Tax=Aspergillus luchuensis (strain CBS 106.47) TaxID=1137211 RepID=A0A1M3T032_ASPLC|nr:hypothetical protein ASPFODRAFT_708857 [Aspergillus luchuensis CBS 106.47]
MVWVTVLLEKAWLRWQFFGRANLLFMKVRLKFTCHREYPRVSLRVLGRRWLPRATRPAYILPWLATSLLPSIRSSLP